MSNLPANSIGWFYRVLGVMLMFASVVLIAFKLYVKHELNTFDVIVFTLLFFAALGLVRPALFDKLSKRVADALPFFRYSKETDRGETDVEERRSVEVGTAVRDGRTESD